MIRKLVAALATVAVIATSTIAASAPAEAYYRHWHHGVGPAIVGGLIGGLALGAIVNSHRYYYDDYYDGPYYDCRRVLYENQYGERYWRRVCD